MTSCRLVINYANGSSKGFDKCISFTFKKEFYTPYTLAAGTFVWERADCLLENSVIIRADLYINSRLVHTGLPDKLELGRKNGINTLSFSSRGYTSLLGQNEPQPGVIPEANLGYLIDQNINSPYITYQEGTIKTQYIYVKEQSTVWDALNAYTLKVYGTRPYIRSTGTVMATAVSTSQINYASVLKTNYKETMDTTLLLSEVYMANLQGDYIYHSVSSDAVAAGIIRTKYYPFDNQWVLEPDVGLQGILDFSQRKIRQQSFVYSGYMNEDLMDTVSNYGEKLNGKRINAITVTGGKNGVFTQVSCYDDKYGQKN